MSDFDELIDFLTDAIGQVVDNIPNGDDIIDHVQDSIQSVLEKLDDMNVDIDDENKEIIVNKLAEALNVSPEMVSDSIATISQADSTSFADNVSDNVSDIEISTDKTWKGDFQGICWDECLASVKDPGKRMTCGYYA